MSLAKPTTTNFLAPTATYGAFTIAFLAGLLCTPMTQAEEFDLYYLGGQSNMDGYGTNGDLPDELNATFENTWIFHGNTEADSKPVDGRGIWEQLKPGHGVGFKSDGKVNQLSNRFGVELSFARALQKKSPNRKVAIIKYSRGGTSIHQDAAGRFGCWEPDFELGEGAGKGINQYDHFLATMRYALRNTDVDGDGEPDKLVPRGIVWMQGESDAGSAEIAGTYEANLKRLMDLIRASLHRDDLPVVIGRISDSGKDEKDGKVWDFGDQVRAAQESFAGKDTAAAVVKSTDKYGYSDPWHYDSAGYIDLGKEFAEAMMKLTQN